MSYASAVLAVSAEALFELALQHVPATSMRNSRWGYRAIRAGESRIPAPIGEQTTSTWTASVQADRRHPASCHSCRRPFVVGAARVASAAAALAGKWLHPACVAGGLGLLHDVVGFAALPEAAQEEIQIFH